jgi:ATP-dependent helicase/nuclease subunit B
VTETKLYSDSAAPINVIAKSDALGRLRAFNYLPEHPAMALWLQPKSGLFARLLNELKQRHVHVTKCVVVLPYAQLLPLATRLWAQMCPNGFSPRFETTANWSAALGAPSRNATDITFDAGIDTLTAQALLQRAGLGAQQDALAAMLVQSAHQLAPLAAAAGPDGRSAWAQKARVAASLGLEPGVLAWEAAVARIAVEWAAVSNYASDAIFSTELRSQVDCLVVVQGNNPDPFASGLAAFWGERIAVLPLAQTEAVLSVPLQVALHACLDAEDEAQRTTACCLAHIEARRYPLALVSSDRALTRRVRAMLEGAGVHMRDENGWKLSTSSAAARLIVMLRACAWNASADDVLDWIKTIPNCIAHCDTIEAALRRDQVRDWRHAATSPAIAKDETLVTACAEINALRARLKGSRVLSDWLGLLRSALQQSGLWDALLADGAGEKVLAVLHITEDASSDWHALAASALWAQRRMDLSEFTQWVNQALEGANFKPAYPDEEQVVFLPMSQMLARPFAALVLAGCDEVRLNPNAEPPGVWTAAQREALGLPSRNVLETLVRTAWHHALHTPVCDVLWRTSDEAGETVLPSSLVQLMQMDAGATQDGRDPRALRQVQATPVQPPQPVGTQLPVRHLSASAYDDLRQCPYRFFALRQLGLKTNDELESEVDKRDFGVWLHAVLGEFHEALRARMQQGDAVDLAQRVTMIDAAAAATTASMGLPDGEFLPFAAAWPAVRTGYLNWLAGHEAEGAIFTSTETSHSQPLGSVSLVGRIDRIDTLADGSLMVMDYKTESATKTKQRIKNPLEDTQIAFYAALLPNDTLRAAYINLGEGDHKTGTVEQLNIVEARDTLIHGIQTDMQHIADSAPLPALGDGPACDYCQARGLCRKDFWSVP